MIPYPDITGSPRTGQTVVYQAGDDGTHQAGHPSTSRFADVGNGTIRDTLYTPELLWIKQPELIFPGGSGQLGDDFGSGASLARENWATTTAYKKGDLVSRDGADAAPYFVANVDHTSDGAAFANDVANWNETVWAGSAADLTTPATMNWGDTITACEALDYNGYTDWRLPNIVVLFSLINFGKNAAPKVYDTYFPNIDVTNYWSSTTNENATTRAQVVAFSTSGTEARQDKVNTYFVLPMRGGNLNG